MDRANNDFFRPRGLYCLIMSYKPIATDKKAKVDPALAMLDHEPSSSGSGFPSKAKRNLRNPLAGVSHGEESLPDSVARLVFPTKSNESEGTNKKKKVFSKLNNYFDQRAQARYVS